MLLYESNRPHSSRLVAARDARFVIAQDARWRNLDPLAREIRQSRLKSGRPRTEHREGDRMRRILRAVSLAGLSSVMLVAGNPAAAQKPGGILRVYLTASP